ncbi:hypothetical protein [Nostoc sp. C110]|uniref:hypothetical protein n=1 Tax=Nostoc sp. C110 TaxID=3349876 RepID=UPI00370D3872
MDESSSKVDERVSEVDESSSKVDERVFEVDESGSKVDERVSNFLHPLFLITFQPVCASCC